MLRDSSLSLRTAGAAVGLNKTTILRAIQKGTISAKKNVNNEWIIEPAELFRVYRPIPLGDAATGAASPATGAGGQDTAPQISDFAPLQQDATPATAQERLAAAEASLAALKILLAEVQNSRDDWRTQAQTLLLQAPQRQSLLKRLFG